MLWSTVHPAADMSRLLSPSGGKRMMAQDVRDTRYVACCCSPAAPRAPVFALRSAVNQGTAQDRLRVSLLHADALWPDLHVSGNAISKHLVRVGKHRGILWVGKQQARQGRQEVAGQGATQVPSSFWRPSLPALTAPLPDGRPPQSSSPAVAPWRSTPHRVGALDGPTVAPPVTVNLAHQVQPPEPTYRPHSW